jgi:Rrf2 family protein
VRLSTRTRYAARALAELATVRPPATTTLKDVARSQKLSPKYLERIFNTLRAHGLLQTVRGLHGGYALARPPETITLREVCETLDGPVALVDCVDCPESCPRKDICPTRDTWVEITQAIVGILQRTTIRDLAERRNGRTGASPPIYQI